MRPGGQTRSKHLALRRILVEGDVSIRRASKAKNREGSRVCQLLLFPSPGTLHVPATPTPTSVPIAALQVDVAPPSPAVQADVVLSGTFRRDPKGLEAAFDNLLELGCRILSPRNVRVESERDGFVFMEGESWHAPEALERRHLQAIESAQFVWLHAPDGYVGLSGALEIGFACSAGIPVFSTNRPKEASVANFVNIVATPEEALVAMRHGQPHTPKSLPAFQDYYRRIAIQRGYASENAKDCLLLMLEEVGELARALRKQQGLVRHHANETTGLEVADVFLYLVHLANILNVDLAKLVKEKEALNHNRFIEHARRHGQL